MRPLSILILPSYVYFSNSFPTHVQTRTGAHPASRTLGTEAVFGM